MNTNRSCDTWLSIKMHIPPQQLSSEPTAQNGKQQSPCLCSAHRNDCMTVTSELRGWIRPEKWRSFTFQMQDKKIISSNLIVFSLKKPSSLFLFKQTDSTPTRERTHTALCSCMKVNLSEWSKISQAPSIMRQRKQVVVLRVMSLGLEEEKEEKTYETFQGINLKAPEYSKHSASSTSIRMWSGCSASSTWLTEYTELPGSQWVYHTIKVGTCPNDTEELLSFTSLRILQS